MQMNRLRGISRRSEVATGREEFCRQSQYFANRDSHLYHDANRCLNDDCLNGTGVVPNEMYFFIFVEANRSSTVDDRINFGFLCERARVQSS